MLLCMVVSSPPAMRTFHLLYPPDISSANNTAVRHGLTKIGLSKKMNRDPPEMWACGAAGSALPWHGRGRRFDPDQVHQIIRFKINRAHRRYEGKLSRIEGTIRAHWQHNAGRLACQAVNEEQPAQVLFLCRAHGFFLALRVQHQRDPWIGMTHQKEPKKMAKKRYTPEQIVSVLRQVGGGRGPWQQACRDAGIVEQTYYRWQKEYGG